MSTEEEEEEELSLRCWLRTLFAASGPMMMWVFFGIIETQSAVMLPELKKKCSQIHITPDEETWIASLGVVGAPISALLVGPTIDIIGRKKGLLFVYIIIGVGFGTIACATKVWHIYLGRIITSFGMGLNVSGVVYLAEICTKKQRSIFLSINGAILTTGVSLCYFVSYFLPWNIASGVFCLACFACLIIVCFTPESPAWLFKTSKEEACTRSLQRLGRSPSGIFRELELLKLSNKEGIEKFQHRAFFEPTIWKPFLIFSFFHLLTCLSGAYYVTYYTVDLIERLDTSYNAFNVGLVMSIARFVANFTIGVYFTAYVRRKVATTMSGFGMAATIAGAGIYEYIYRNVAAIDKPLQWIPVTLLITNVVAGFIGATYLPWLMMGEVFPLHVRGAMTGAIYVMCNVLMFISLKTYVVLVETLKIWGLFFLCAAASFATIILGIFFVPDTLNKTLYEVEQSFLPKKRGNSPKTPLLADS